MILLFSDIEMVSGVVVDQSEECFSHFYLLDFCFFPCIFFIERYVFLFLILNFILVYGWLTPWFNSWIRKGPRRRDRRPTPVFLGFPGGSDGKESACNAGDLDSIPGLGRSPGGGHVNLFQNSCLENPHGERNLAGYSPWVAKSQTWLSDSAQHRWRWGLLHKLKLNCIEDVSKVIWVFVSE